MVVCGASEAPLFPTFADTFGNARALARGWDDPTEASRPFDLRRNGFVLRRGRRAAGAGDAPSTPPPGAPPATPTSPAGASTTDAHHPTAPRPDGAGAAECMRRALRDAGVPPARSATSTRTAPAPSSATSPRSIAIGAVVRRSAAPPVSSTKALTGHMLGASGVRGGGGHRAGARDAACCRRRTTWTTRIRPARLDHIRERAARGRPGVRAVELVRVRRPEREPAARSAPPSYAGSRATRPDGNTVRWKG